MGNGLEEWNRGCVRTISELVLGRIQPPSWLQRNLAYFGYASAMPGTLYMVVEHCYNGDPLPVYRRFREHGRRSPKGWSTFPAGSMMISPRCYQVMQASDRRLLDEWMARWSEPPRVSWRLHSLRGWGHGQTESVFPRDRAVRMVLAHQALRLPDRSIVERLL